MLETSIGRGVYARERYNAAHPSSGSGKTGSLSPALGRGLLSLALVLAGCAVLSAQTNDSQPGAAPGAGSVIVHSKFGGQIFGFDIDQNGTEGVLSESQDLSNGNVLAAVETFDQKTGKILKVVAQTQTEDDFVTLGVVGNSVGLVEHEHVQGIFVVKRTFHTMNPL